MQDIEHAVGGERRIPVGWIAAAVMVAVVGVMVALVVAGDGTFTYPLDDTYIHLRIAENLRHGVLGINPHEFASATSSPLWSAVLALAVWIGGVRAGVPLVLATVIAAAVLVGVDRWARSNGLAVRERVLLAAALVVIVPLPTVAFIGMEHALQVAVALLVTALGTRLVLGATGRIVAITALVAAIGTAVRPEILFVLAPIVVWLLFGRRWAAAASITAAGVIPLGIMALIYTGQGWPPLPASVLVKSSLVRSGIARFLPHLDLTIFLKSRLLFVLLACLLAWVAGRRALGASWPRSADVWASVFVAATAIHLGYAQIGWLFRYEAYLVALGVCATALCLHARLTTPDAPPLPRVQLVALFFLALVATLLGLRATVQPIRSSHEIHDQQVQMARFARTACPRCRVAANDIGVVALDGDVTVTDVYGLANRDVLEAKRNGTWDTAALEDLTRREGATLAMVYADPAWIPGVPDSWERLGTWTFPPRLLGQSVVSFYSIDPARTAELRRSFEDFGVPDGAERQLG